MREPLLVLIAFLLTAAGFAVFSYKAAVLGFPLRPGAETELWIVEARLTFEAWGGPVTVTLQLPGQTPALELLDEDFVSRGYGLFADPQGDLREARWTRRRADGEQALYYRAVLGAAPRSRAPAASALQAPELEEAERAAFDALVDDVRAHSAGPESFARELLKRLTAPSPGDDVRLLLRGAEGAAGRSRLAVRVLAAAGIPARIARGVLLEDQRRRAALETWLEIHDRERWRFFDPETGAEGLPERFLIWFRGEGPLARVTGGSKPKTVISVRRSLAEAVETAARRAELGGSRLVELSLLGLPIRTQAIYGVLLLVPIGGFIMVLLRNVVGVRTFGTFLPVLVALSFRETRLVWGLLLFTLLVALGLAVRFYLERLRLLLVPRLAAVLTVVVLLMVAVSVVSHRLDLEIGLSVALFPMVILTIAIEHMSIVWEERGAAEAIKQGLGTLAVAAFAYLVMSLRGLQHLVFLFPELLLVLLAAILLLGRYSGYRLLELVRFRALGAGS